MIFCVCDGTLGNTGVPEKQRVISSGAKLIAVNMKASDGSFNQIGAGEDITAAYLLDKLNEVDPTKRWYPIGEFKNQDDVRADPLTEAFSDGSNALTQQGVRTFTGWLVEYSSAYLAPLESFACQSFGLFVVDDCGSLIGSVTPDGANLRPIRVNEKMWSPTLIKANPTISSKVQLVFEWSQLEKDKYLRLIKASEMGANLLEAEGLLPLAGNPTVLSATQFSLALKVQYDVFPNASKEVVPGWVQTDFSVFNVNTNSNVPVISSAEAPVGTYTLDIAAQTAGDALIVRNVRTSGNKPGFYLEETITAV